MKSVESVENLDLIVWQANMMLSYGVKMKLTSTSVCYLGFLHVHTYIHAPLKCVLIYAKKEKTR